MSSSGERFGYDADDSAVDVSREEGRAGIVGLEAPMGSLNTAIFAVSIITFPQLLLRAFTEGGSVRLIHGVPLFVHSEGHIEVVFGTRLPDM